MTDVKLNYYCYIVIVEIIYMCAKKLAQARLKIISIKCISKFYIFIHMYQKDLVLNNLHWLICHKTKRNQIIYI